MKWNVVTSVLVILYAYSNAVSGEKRYNGHQVLHVTPKSRAALQKVKALHHLYDADVWRHPTKLNYSMDLYVTPDKMNSFLEELKQLDIDVHVWINDIQRLIDEEKSSVKRHIRNPRLVEDLHNRLQHEYLTYDEIREFLNSTASHQDKGVKVEKKVIGTTVEGRKIDIMHISKGGNSKTKKKIFIDGGIHAREWISPAFVLNFIRKLVYNNSDDDVQTLLRNFDWYIVPLVNPDGYVYSHTNDRLWRKNRRMFRENGKCHGIDLNRNFDFNWNPATGGSVNPCSSVFSGQSAASENETQALQNFILANKDNMIAYFTIHSYGQMWVYPWGFKTEPPKDWQDLDALAQTTVKAVNETYGTDYVYGSSTSLFELIAGSSEDWAKGGAGVKYSYTVELRDKGRNGFILPSDQILPTTTETWNAHVAFCKELLRRNEA